MKAEVCGGSAGQGVKLPNLVHYTIRPGAARAGVPGEELCLYERSGREWTFWSATGWDVGYVGASRALLARAR